MALRIKGHTNHDMFKTVALAVAALVLFSCQNDDFDDDNKVTIYPVIKRSVETSIQTRALEGNYSEFTEDLQTFTANAVAFDSQTGSPVTTEDKQGVFAPSVTENTISWRSTVDVTENYRYNLYAYSRTMPSATAPVFAYGNGSNTSLTFTGLNILSTTDPLVSVAASGAVLPDNPTQNQYPDLNKGQFNIGVITTVQAEGTSSKAFLAFDHLYSKATLSFAIDNTYSQLRTVHIKDIQIKVNNGTLSGTHVYRFNSQQLQLDNNQQITGAAASVDLFDGTTATAVLNGATIEQDADGDNYIELGTSYLEFGYYYFLPLEITPAMYLEVKYDILDREGNKVRKDQIARNDNLFKSINGNGGKAAAGTNYKVKILVSPTYLYQLSDDDLELGLTIE